MKRALTLLIFVILFTSCDRNSTYSQTLNSDVTISDTLQKEFTVKENEEIKPLFEKGKSTKKHGVEMVENYFKNAMIKGEDGSCYYYRKQEKGGGRLYFIGTIIKRYARPRCHQR